MPIEKLKFKAGFRRVQSLTVICCDLLRPWLHMHKNVALSLLYNGVAWVTWSPARWVVLHILVLSFTGDKCSRGTSCKYAGNPTSHIARLQGFTTEVVNTSCWSTWRPPPLSKLCWFIWILYCFRWVSSVPSYNTPVYSSILYYTLVYFIIL